MLPEAGLSVFPAGRANPVHLDKGINQIGLYWLKFQFCHKVLFGLTILKKKKANVRFLGRNATNRLWVLWGESGWDY